MTAAHRMKGVGWFGSCVVVVLAFYLVSLQVAAERKKLDAVNAQVADAERDIRALETEFDTRANLAQLERWNGDTLALTAPVAGQFVADETALAAIDVTAGPAAGPDGAPIRTVALLVPSLAPSLSGVTLQTTAAPTDAAPMPATSAVVQTAAATPVHAQPVPVVRTIATTPRQQAAMLRAVAVANVRPQAVAMLDRKLLSDSTLGDILSGARIEAGKRR